MSAPAFPASPALTVDRSEIARFVHALFPGLDNRGFVSLRAFRQSPPKGERDTPLHVEAIGLNLGTDWVIDRAVAIATRIANGGEAGVFAPPITTFAGRKGAKSGDVFESPVLSVECDQGDLERVTDGLSLILGERPTIALHSGSIWIDPATGEPQPKGHLHWRLARPAYGPEQQQMLRRARVIATLFAGGDPTGIPVVHPLRWPGSWNCKSDPPVMAKIIEENASTIDLVEALAALEDAAEAANLAPPKDAPHLAADDLPAELAQLAAWLKHYTTANLPAAGQGLRHGWNKVAMAIHRATSGSENGFKLFREWSAASASPFYTEAGCRRRWDAITGCPPSWIGARFLRRMAIEHGWVPEPPVDWEQSHPLNGVEEARQSKSSSGNLSAPVTPLQGVNGGGGGGGAGGDSGDGGGGGEEEPPPGWEANRPLLGGPVPTLLLEDLTAPRWPNTTMAELRAKMTAGVEAWVNGEGPAHLANTFATGVQKNRITITLLAAVAKAKRKARRDFMTEFRFKNPDAPRERVAQAANDAGLGLLRVACIVPDHGLAKQHAELARSLGMFVAQDAGIERHVDPTDPNTPPLCSQHKRVEQSRRAGEPVRLTACGLDLDHPHCVDRAGCYKWQQIRECFHAEFVTMVAERANSYVMPRELRHFDYVLIDEPPDRVFLPQTEIKLDLLDDHLLRSRAPVLHETGEIDEEGTEEARAIYKTLRDALAARNNGYDSWDRDAMNAAGCDAAFFERFVYLTDKRDRSTGMTAATPDDVREEMARESFRNSVRKLCAFGRLAGAIQAGEEGEGRIELDGDAPRLARMRPPPTLNSTLLGARIMVTGAGLDLDDIRRWLPDAEPMDGCDGIPEAPHQTLVHMHIAMGARAMERPQRLRFAKAFVTLEGDTSRKDSTGVLTLKDYEGVFNGIPGIITGHHGAIVGRNDWMNTTTFFNFQARFLKPRDAAALGAAYSGEKVPVQPPVRQHRRIALTGGKDAVLPVMDYEHPSAAAANRRVRDFDILQGPLARPRAADRTADTSVLTFNIGTAVPGGCEVNYLVARWEDYAPERMAIAWAERGYITQHPLGRHVLHPDVYTESWTGQNDQRLETDGFKATVLRMIVPPWRDGPAEPCYVGHLWRSGHAYRTPGEEFICTVRAYPTFKAEALAKYGATRFEIDHTLWPYRPLTETEAELTINPESVDTGEFIDSSGGEGLWMPPGGAPSSYRVEHPPDG